MRLPKYIPATLAALALHAAPAAAQSLRPAPSRIIAVNPFLPLAGSFQAEVEQKVRPNLSLAVSGSYIDFGEEEKQFSNADLKLRLYPSERALEGFAIAIGVGAGRQSALRNVFCPAIYPGGECTSQRRNTSGPTFSVETHYQWLLGSKRNTAVTAGGGLKRYFIDTKPDGFVVFDEFRPTVRLTIGYAFR